jgi:hypothetical protein
MSVGHVPSYNAIAAYVQYSTQHDNQKQKQKQKKKKKKVPTSTIPTTAEFLDRRVSDSRKSSMPSMAATFFPCSLLLPRPLVLVVVVVVAFVVVGGGGGADRGMYCTLLFQHHIQETNAVLLVDS